jgi:iron complex outermembrane recepter protein
MNKRFLNATLAGTAGLLSVTLAWSQSDTAGAAHASVLEEIIVTAQKRSENLQNVPISIAALGREQLERIDSASFVDLARRVPGLSFRSTGPGENEIVVRGIASASAGLRPTTGYYLDETPISALGLGAIDAGLFDLERVEVLRGPQGTLYGSGSMGGTVRLISAKPDFTDFSARGDVSLATTRGGDMSEAVNAGVNVPFSDTLALRAVGYYRDDGGWIERARRVMTFNAHDASQYQADYSQPIEKNVNEQRTGGVRVALAFQPTESLTITPSVFYQNIDMDARADYDEPAGNGNHQIQTRIVPEFIKDKFTLTNLTAKYSGKAVELLSSTSYFDRKRVDVEDISTVALFFFQPPGIQDTLVPGPYTTDQRNHAFVEEVRLSTLSEGPLRLVVGAFYSDSTSNLGTLSEGPGFSAQTGFPIVDDIFSSSFTQVNTTEKALFGELSYEPIERLTFTIGARGFQSETKSFGTRGGFAVDPPPNPPPFGDVGVIVPPLTQKENGINPKFLVSWQATADALIYATAAKGFRPGGVNGPFPVAFCGADLAALNLSAAPETYESDSLWNYEVGAKTRWLDHRLTLNAAAYHVDWSDVQQEANLPCGFSFLGNFGSAESNGAELELTAQVANSLVLSAGAGYNKAELTSGGLPGLAGQSGDRLQNAPEWTISSAADYSTPVGPNYMAGFTVSYQYTSEVFGSFDPTNADYQRPGYSTVQLNARIGNDKYEYSLFVNNLTDVKAQTAFAGSAALDFPGGAVRVAVPIRPRTIGVKVAAKF